MIRDEPSGPATPGLAGECRRQTAIAAASDRAGAGLIRLLDSALEELGNMGWSAAAMPRPPSRR